MSRLPKDTGDNELGRAIRAARVARDWSQGDLARRVGCSRTYIARLESASYRPNISADIAFYLRQHLRLPYSLLRPDGWKTPPVADTLSPDPLEPELSEFTELAVRLGATSGDIRVAKAVLQTLHEHRVAETQEAEAFSLPPPPPDAT